MKIRQQFKQRVIELIHGVPYEECEGYMIPDGVLFKHADITIGRVMQAFKNRFNDNEYCKRRKLVWNAFAAQEIIIIWKLTKEGGQECTDDDQTDETIEALYNLIK